MNYTLHQLRIFLKVTQTESVTKAAEELHLTQPAVSIQLKNFQEQFSVPLTEVIGRQLYVTDFGKEIAEVADEILNQVSAINHRALSFKGEVTGRLKISVVSTGKYVMPYFLTDFIKKYPGVDLRMDVTNKMGVLNSLENNEVDFSLVSILPPMLQVDALQLLENKLYLIGSSASELGDEIYSTDLLQNLPLIFRERGSGTRQTMEGFILNQNIPFQKKRMELTSNEAVKQAVLAGLGYSIMPIIGIKNELREARLRIIRVRGLPIVTSWNLIWVKKKKHSPIADAFLNHVKKNKQEIIRKWFGEV